MAKELDLPKALAEFITQINNLRRLVTIGGKQYKYDAKSNSYKGDGGKSFSVSQLKGKAREAFQTIKTAGKSTAKKLKIKDRKTFSRAPKKNLVQTPSPTWGVDQNKTKSTPKTTAKKTKTNKTKGVKQKTQYKTTGKPPVQIKPKKLIKGASKILKKIRKVPGAGMVGRGVARGIGLAGGGAQLYGLGENLVDHARGVTNLVQRARKKPYKTFGATGNKKKLIELEDAKYRGDKLKVKKTNNKKTNTTTSTKSQLDQNIDKAKGWNKRQLQKKKDYQSKFGKLSNIPAKEGNATVPGSKSSNYKAKKINPDFGKKPNLTIKSKKKSGSKYPAKIGGKKTSAIQKKLLDSGFTAAQLAEKMRKHKEWKAARGRR